MDIKEHVSLKELTTFKIGGKARYFCVVKEPDDIARAVSFAEERKVPFFVLGGGSNVLVADEGFPGLSIKMDLLGVEFNEKGRGAVEVVAGAGENWDGLVDLCVEKGLYGLENLSGIPGSVGAAPVQNIGAYGTEVKEVISWVEVFDPAARSFKIFSKKECGFGYRDSIFKTSAGAGLIISRVGFVLKMNDVLHTEYKDLAAFFAAKNAVSPADVRDAVLKIRAKKFPDLREFGTAGSFFKNPFVTQKEFDALHATFPDMPHFPSAGGGVKIPLGWILDHVCHLKGIRDGAVGTFKGQALVLVNYGGASAADVILFATNIATSVKEKTGLSIEWEVRKIE